MKVFWSWQNDTNAKVNRHFIRDALSEAVKQAGVRLGLEDAERPLLDHDTKGAPGVAEIPATILQKISESAIFVADITPIGLAHSGKALPNPNVLIELGWALRKPGPERIIVVLNTADGHTPDDLPFDIRHRRVLTYKLDQAADAASRKKAKNRLVEALAEAITLNLSHHIQEVENSAEVTGVAASATDPSIWASFNGRIEYYSSMHKKNSVTVPDGPRAYLRMIPDGWKRGAPSLADVRSAQVGLNVHPVAEVSSNGDFGPCEQGFVSLWFTGHDESRNVALWFDDTGEYWILHGTAIVDWEQGKMMLRATPLLRGWRENLKAGMRFFDHFEASPVRKVEAGLVGINGAMWEARMVRLSAPARKDHVISVRQDRDWNDESQIEFLTTTYNQIRNAFGFQYEDSARLKKMTDSK